MSPHRTQRDVITQINPRVSISSSSGMGDISCGESSVAAVGNGSAVSGASEGIKFPNGVESDVGVTLSGDTRVSDRGSIRDSAGWGDGGPALEGIAGTAGGGGGLILSVSGVSKGGISGTAGSA